MTHGLSSPSPRGTRLAFAAAIGLASLASLPALAQGTGGDCQPDPQTLCLLDDRFEVKVEWHDFTPNPLAVPGTPDDGAGQAVPVPLSGSSQVDGGYFWFFDSQNVDLVVKIFDGRNINNRFWVFAGSLTNVEYRITVVDTVTDKTQPYVNPPGDQTVVFDTDAFDGDASGEIRTESGATGGAGEALSRMARLARISPISRPVAAGGADGVPHATLLPEEALPSCADVHVACVQGDRIAIQARVPLMMGGPVDHESEVIVETGTSALFQHFASNGPELGVKTVDGRSVNGQFRVFVTGLSFPGLTVMITDLETQEQVT